MKFWHSITSKYRVWKLGAQLELTYAYQAVFRGTPDRVQQEQVLADLGARCCWNQVTVPDSTASDRELWFREGKRAAFAEIYAHLSLSPDDMMALDNAVRREAAASTNQN